MIGIGFVYAVIGASFAAYAAASAARGRLGNAAFWGLLAVSFLLGGRIGDFGNGLLALALAVIAGARLLRPAERSAIAPEARAASAARHGDRLFLPALLVPAVAIAGTLGLPRLRVGGAPLVDPGQATLIALAIGTLAALAIIAVWLKPRAAEAAREGVRLIDAVGWAVVLPQMLAALGAMFAIAHVGDVLGGGAARLLPLASPLPATIAYALGMALLTMLLGNAFAAFPVMMAAVGLPILVRRLGGDPAPIAAIGMLSGFCGTLLTPLAANFNIVPVGLLGLSDRYAVIRRQAGTALPLLAFNIVLIWSVAFR